MKLVLADYQQQVRDFLLSKERAFAMVGVGLGKSASTLSALNTLFLDGEIRSALVVAPLRVANLTWPNEIEKWDQFRWMRVQSLRHQKPKPGYHIYTINYESLQKLTSLDFCDVVVFDESTKAKNHRSVRIKAIAKLLKGHRRWALTGTPRPNSLTDLFGQVRLLDDGERLGRSFSTFQDTWMIATDFKKYHWVPREGAEESVYRKISDISITMRTSDHLDLPETIVEDVEVVLPDDAKRTYKELERELIVSMGDKGDVIAPQASTLVDKLRQITGGFVYTEDRTVVHVHSAKIEELKALLKRLKGENVIVLTNFIHEREGVCRAIPSATDISTVEGDLEKQWNRGDFPCLVADPRSMGHGLNLQEGGRTIVWFSPTYSRESYDQGNGRTARRGQGRQTQLFRLLCRDTIDSAVIETLREKGEGQAQMLKLLSNLRKQVLQA